MKSLLLFLCALAPAYMAFAESVPVDLKCDYRITPLAVDRANPVFSWCSQSSRRDFAQTKYRVQVASSESALDAPDLWDSGWVESPASTGVAYAGKALESKQRIYWRVGIIDDQGEQLAWSEPTWFEVGLLNDSDWMGAEWIACSRAFQAEWAPKDVMGDWIAAQGADATKATFSYSFDFTLPDKYVVYAGAWWNHIESGKIVASVNGQKGTSSIEGEGTIYYKDYGFLLKRDNEVRIELKNAKQSTPISFGMRIVFADGTEQWIQSSADWKVNGEPAQVVCKYGEAPLGEAKISPRAPLPVAWYKQDFGVSQSVASARLYVCGLGYFEPYLNGVKVGDHVLDPGQTDYPQLAHYQVFDATDYLVSGDNALSLLLGDGWYNNDRMFSKSKYAYGKPGLRAYLDIQYKDGSRETMVSDESWKWKPSGIAMSSMFMGDQIDYRNWHTEWESAGFPAGWQSVQAVKPLAPKLIAQDMPPIRVVKEFEPVKLWQIGEKTWIADMGQNISGWVGLEFDEPAGTEIRMRFTEMLTEDGKYLDNVPASFLSCHAAPQQHYIISDGKPRKWRPYFNYHGFRYVEIHGLSEAPEPGQIKGMFVHTDVPTTASFRSSEPLLDRIFQMGIDTHYCNMHSILEDCPHREKCLWGGDLHSSWATGFYTLDSATFYRQQIQLYYTPPFDPKGIPGRIGVGKRHTDKALDFTWSVSPLFLAYRNYKINGDIQTPEAYYDVMLNFLKFTEKDSTKLMPNIYRYGDHAWPIGIERNPQDPQLIAGLHFFAAAERFAVFAERLGKREDAEWSRVLAERIRQSLIENYYDSAQHTFGNGTHDSLALEFGVVRESEQEKLGATLAKTYYDNGKQFDGGFMSYFIYPQLTENGHVDLALEMLLNPDYPGIAQSIRDYDATTIFERYRSDSRRNQVRQSLNHHAMNHPTAWMLNYLAGIRSHPDEIGFRRILLQPYIPPNLDWVEAQKETPYGLVKSSWKQEGTKVTWEFTVPANSEAEVRLPGDLDKLQMDGKRVAEIKASYSFGAGSYRLEWDRLN